MVTHQAECLKGQLWTPYKTLVFIYIYCCIKINFLILNRNF